MATGRTASVKLSTTKQPNQPPTNSRSSTPPASTADLASLVNLRVRIQTAGDSPRTLEGTLYTYDPVTSFAVLSPSPAASAAPSDSSSSSSAFSSKRDYHLVKTSHITHVSVLSSTPDASFPALSDPLPTGPSPSPAALSSRVQQTVSHFDKERLRLGPRGTPSEVQDVYDRLSKTLPVRWTPTGEIVVLDEVVVNPTDWSIKGGKGTKDRIDRVGKVLEGIRARLAANGGGGGGGGDKTPTIA